MVRAESQVSQIPDLENRIEDYHGLTKEQVESVLNSGRMEDIPLTGHQRNYLERILDAEKFYIGRRRPEGDDIALDNLRSKYLAPNETGPLHMWHRVAKALSSVEATPEKQQEAYYGFMDLMDDFKFVPGGRIMHGAGRDDIKVTLNNCYVLELEGDSVDAIYKLVEDEGKTYKKGGGCGHTLTTLRPRGTSVAETGGASCGPEGFMEIFSTNTNTIAQHGRRGANMQTLHDRHPSIYSFVDIKNDLQKIKQLMERLKKSGVDDDSLEALEAQLNRKRNVQYSNISVLVSDDLMDAVKRDADFPLIFPDIEAYQKDPAAKKLYNEKWRGNYDVWTKEFTRAQEEGKISKDLKPIKEHARVKARDLWGKIIHNAWESAEPGILFWDTIQRFHNLEYVSPASSTNPCGEQPLPKGGCCNLGSLNLEKFVDGSGRFMEGEFNKTIRNAVRFLDNVIDYNVDRHALPVQKENALGDRRIGLGVTGLADMLVRMGIKYDSEEALLVVDRVMKIMRDTSYNASIELAREKGTFPNFNWEGYSKSKFIQNMPEDARERIKTEGIRNGTILTVPPVGTGSIVAETSSGIEPIFATGYDRDVKDHTDPEKKVTYRVVHPLIKHLFGGDSNLPPFVVEAHAVDPLFRVRMQGTVQRYIDSSISSTVNLPEDVSEETVSKIYIAAHEHGLKGITVYRQGSREGVLRTNKKGLEHKLESAPAPTLVQLAVKSHPVLEIKPSSVKYKIKRNENEDSLHIILTSDIYVDDKRKKAYFMPEEVFQVRAPLGSATTVSFAQSGMDRTEILRGPNPNYAELVARLQSANSNEEEGIGPRKIKSIEHAAGIAFEDYFMRNGIIGRDQVTGKLTNLVDKRDLRKVERGSKEYEELMAQLKEVKSDSQIEITGTNGKLDSKFKCTRCGGTEYAFESGCHNPKCVKCGEFQGGSCG